VHKSFFALLGLVLTSFALKYILPISDNSLVQTKFDLFLANKDLYTTVVLGSSVSYKHIDPIVLDIYLQQHQFNSHTFNFALPSVRLQESEFLLRKILQAKPKNLKYVIMDTAPLLTSEYNHENWTNRQLYWHDFQETYNTIKHLLYFNPKLKFDNFLNIIDEINAMELNLLGWGRLSFLLFQTNEPLGCSLETLVKHNGFCPASTWKIVKLKPEVEQDIIEKNKGQVSQALRNHFNYKTSSRLANIYENMLLIMKPSGLQLILHTPPFLMLAAKPKCLYPECYWIDLSSPQENPDIFQKEKFFDVPHLNLQGSILYTTRLGEKILKAQRSGVVL
jgi:hypothetical protein